MALPLFQTSSLIFTVLFSTYNPPSRYIYILYILIYIHVYIYGYRYGSEDITQQLINIFQVLIITSIMALLVDAERLH